MYKRTTTQGLFAPTAVLRAVRTHQNAQNASSNMNTGTGQNSSFDAPLFMGSSTPNVITTSATIAELEKAELTHVVPSTLSDHASIHGIRLLRWVSDKLFKERYIHRAFMLVGVSGAPNAAMMTVEHFRAQFKDEAPKGVRVNLGAWENRRMHHAIVNQLSPPTVLDRCLMAVVQILHYVLFFILSVFSPRTAYRLAAYLAEEATVLLTHMVNDVDLGKVQDVDAPSLAVDYWGIQSQSAFESSSPSLGVAAETAFRDAQREEQESQPGTAESAPPEDPLETTQTPSNTDSSSAAPTETSSSAGEDDRAPSEAPSTVNAFRQQEGQPAASSPAPTAGSGVSKRVPRLREVVLLMRADEMVHRDVCHRIADAYDQAKLKNKEVRKSV